MSAPALHPRRRPARAINPSMTTTAALVDSFEQMSLRKGETFQASSAGQTELWHPLDSTPAFPVRSTTCPKSLEDLLLGAGERRAADLLARVDKAIATNSKFALESVLSEPEVLPAPQLDADQDAGGAAVRKTRPRHIRHSHSFDSGLGSSIASASDADSSKIPIVRVESPAPTNRRSMSEISAVSDERGLSKYAAEQIHKHIVKPILRIDSLKEFHPLIRDVPFRIGKKDIRTLRDLEKTLIFLAPDYSRSPLHYLQFCERTVRVLHTTVTTLHESDQKAPADRPYTQGYFLDLVEQIRRYATILQATREKQAKGEELDEMDYSPEEHISIRGGVSHTGEQAELVRIKDGKTISISTGEVLPADEDVASSIKRPMSDAFADNDEALRSMARRKKNAPIEIHECHVCDKEFKRPCDLTKHIKTHERPWKCPDEGCKFHEHGWPTEKERDRHVNDKHSSAPSLYHCLYKPCPYTSKRESNCKQHMEKAHGWEYVRSKNNGKGKATSLTRLPLGAVPPSPASALLTPLTPIAPSPSTHSWSTSERHDSIPPTGMAGPSNYSTPFTQPSPDFASHFNMDFDFNNMSQAIPSSLFPITPAMSEERRFSSSASSHSGIQLDGSSFEDSISPQQLNFDNFDFGDFTFPQQPTPASHASGKLSVDSGFGSTANVPHASPHAQLDQTIASSSNPYDMYMDESYDSAYAAAPSGDFQLFGSNNASTSSGAEMFPALDQGAQNNWANYGGQFDLNATPQLQSAKSALDELFPELKDQ